MILRTFLIFVIITGFLYSQEKLYNGHEIFLWSTSHEYEDSLTYKMQAVSPIYDRNFLITGNYQNLQETIPIPHINDNMYGFENMFESIPNLTFGYGLYKVSIGYDENSSIFEFYLDWRDCDYPYYYNGKNDIWILFDDYWQRCKICWNHEYNHDFDETISWKDIESNHVYRIWEEKQKGIRIGIQNTSGFKNFWKNCLAVTDGNGNPRLFWSKHPTFTTTNYKIYRAVSSVANPRTLTYNLIHTTATDNVFEYTDQDVALGNSDYVFYYVAAYNSNTNSTSEPSNVVTTRGGMYKQNQLSEEHKTGNIKYELSQNTPNPFNPSTTISFTVPSSTEYYSVLQNVTLKVYDILGNEVATLVDENKPAGMYNVQCIMNNASSGVYFYKLKAGSFTETKKMLLMK